MGLPSLKGGRRPVPNSRKNRVKDKARIKEEGGLATEPQKKAVARILSCSLSDPRITRLSSAEAVLIIGALKLAKKNTRG